MVFANRIRISASLGQKSGQDGRAKGQDASRLRVSARVTSMGTDGQRTGYTAMLPANFGQDDLLPHSRCGLPPVAKSDLFCLNTSACIACPKRDHPSRSLDAPSTRVQAKKPKMPWLPQPSWDTTTNGSFASECWRPGQWPLVIKQDVAKGPRIDSYRTRLHLYNVRISNNKRETRILCR